MCSLCGAIGGNEHWADAAPRPGVYTRNGERTDRRRERIKRVAIANRVLAAFGLSLSDWQGSAYLLSSLTGKTAIIDDLGHLWSEAEKLCGRPCDPLDPAVITRMEQANG